MYGIITLVFLLVVHHAALDKSEKALTTLNTFNAETSDAGPTTSRALWQGSQPPMLNPSRPEPPLVTPYNGGSNQENSAQAGRLSQRRGGGANVHTLRGRDDEDAPQGNTYWNGNSTQFGGIDEAKED